jgi:hypothetical protein
VLEVHSRELICDLKMREEKNVCHELCWLIEIKCGAGKAGNDEAFQGQIDNASLLSSPRPNSPFLTENFSTKS